MECISGYICKLLMQHDCVIVPGLGGFVGNYKPAVFDTVRNIFHPPSKGISFNKNLNKNDGLLANEVAQDKKINYDEALKEIENFVTSVQRNLKLHQKVVIDKVGVLSINSLNNQIQFSPDTSVNYLLETYGLTAIQTFPIKREKIEEKITKELKERTPIIMTQTRNSKVWVAAAAVILLFLAIWMPTSYDLSADLNYANLNPFKAVGEAVYTERVFTEISVLPAEDTEEVDVNTSISEIAFIEGKDPIVVVSENVVKPVSTYVKMDKTKLGYHIIGGCFSEKQNAERMVKKLKKKGFSAWIIGKRKGLWAVSYESFATREETLDHLALAKEHNSKAWILKQ